MKRGQFIAVLVVLILILASTAALPVMAYKRRGRFQGNRTPGTPGQGSQDIAQTPGTLPAIAEGDIVTNENFVQTI